MKKQAASSLMLMIIISLLLSCDTHKLPMKITSPNERIETIFSFEGKNAPVYSISYDNKTIIEKSRLSLIFKNKAFSNNLKILKTRLKNHFEFYDLIAGKSKHVKNHFNELHIYLQEKDSLNRKINLIFRVYDDGVAFRYSIPKQKHIKNFKITKEKSEFRLSENAKCWALMLKNFSTNYETVYHHIPIDSIQPGSFIGLPLTIELENGPCLAITEANLTDYAGMYLDKDADDALTLVSKLSPLPDSSGICVKGSTPHLSPWRVIMIGEQPGDLIESNIILNLNEPCAIADPSWIKPGKVAWPWWSGRTVRNVDFDGGMNTETMKHYIDFAADYGLEYLLIDALWYGPHKDPAQDLTTTIPEIDMPRIIKYADNKNVDIVLWINWESTRNQMGKAFPLYEKWGVKGIKIDYMDRDDQEVVNFYHTVIKKAAEHHLLIDFHGAYKPTGIRRTYPNLLTREGVLGLEHTKWSRNVTPEHNVTLPFTRMIAGPMDYTPGGFHNVPEAQFTARYNAPMVMGTRCHHLAMFVVYESPFQMVSDYPGAYREQMAAEFLRMVPATWDETRVLAGKIGDYIVIARRKGQDWFIGAMTDWDQRSLTLALGFLNDDNYKVLIYADGNNAEIRPTRTKISNTTATKTDSLSINMASGGGYVAHFKPITK